MMTSVQMYPLYKIAFSYYKMSETNLYSVLKACKAQMRTHNKKINLKIFGVENRVIIFTNSLKDVRFKKKLFYSFKMIDVVNIQIYRLKFSKQ